MRELWKSNIRHLLVTGRRLCVTRSCVLVETMAAHGTGDVVVESTWQVEDVDDLPQKILWRDSVCELTQETDAANCFALNRPAPPHANAACTLKLILRNGRQVSVLQVLSEASTLELYGKHGEYIGTSKGDLLDDVDGALLFENRIDLRSCQSEILIKVIVKYPSNL